ncbi:MAG: 2'-5' RNA ligase family protein [Spirochaetales bacterium]|nr:2'-5' RNA ligase family protein [Spirochaetales bacterium]
MLRSILLFPRFDQMEMIQEIREKYDPLYGKIDPHITVVFPFDSDTPNNGLKKQIQDALPDKTRLNISTGRIAYTKDNFIILPVEDGAERIFGMHDALYARVFTQFLNKKLEYLPHITVGYFNDGYILYKTMKELSGFDERFTTVIEKITVESIGEDDESRIEFTIDLL